MGDEINPNSRAAPLRSTYGGRTDEAINRAIRAECPGGRETLDAVNDWHKICTRLGWGDRADHGTGAEPLHVTAYRHLLSILDAMEARVRDTYGLPPKPGPDPDALLRRGGRNTRRGGTRRP